MGIVYRSVLSANSGGSLTADSLTITSQPTKRTYWPGEVLDLTGIAASAVVGQLSGNVTPDCAYIPDNGSILTPETTAVYVAYGGLTQPVDLNIHQIESIVVTTPPTITTYAVGDAIDLSGVVVTAYTDSGTLSRVVTSDCTFSPANGSIVTQLGTQTITVSYASCTATINLAVKAVSSIAVTTPPTKTGYSLGGTLDLTGLVVTATFTDSSTSDVTKLCTYNPADGSILDDTSLTSVSVAYHAKYASFSISVVDFYDYIRDKTTTITEDEWIEFINVNGIKRAIDSNETSAFLKKTINITNSAHYNNDNTAYIVGFAHDNSGYTVDILDGIVGGCRTLYYSWWLADYALYKNGFSSGISSLLTSMSFNAPNDSGVSTATTDTVKPISAVEMGLNSTQWVEDSSTKYEAFISLTGTVSSANINFNGGDAFWETLIPVTSDSNYAFSSRTLRTSYGAAPYKVQYRTASNQIQAQRQTASLSRTRCILRFSNNS